MYSLKFRGSRRSCKVMSFPLLVETTRLVLSSEQRQQTPIKGSQSLKTHPAPLRTSIAGFIAAQKTDSAMPPGLEICVQGLLTWLVLSRLQALPPMVVKHRLKDVLPESQHTGSGKMFTLLSYIRKIAMSGLCSPQAVLASRPHPDNQQDFRKSLLVLSGLQCSPPSSDFQIS